MDANNFKSTSPVLEKDKAIEMLRALGQELPTATQLANLKTNNVFAEPGP